MSLKKMIVSGAAALALMGTASMATPVTLEKDGTGDYLLTPVYYAIGNWSTKLKVVNTNTTRAIVAKVVVRDSAQCDELMDFAIYLTPGDVWEGTIKEVGGEIVLTSTDDSMIFGGVPASEVPGGYTINNHHEAVETTDSGCKRVNWHGYVEIFGAVSYDPKDINATWTPCKPLDKKAFYKAVTEGVGINDLKDLTHDDDVTNDALMGTATIYAEAADVNGRRSMMINMRALGNVSEEAVYSGVRGGDTSLSNMSSKGNNLVPEIDRVLGKSNIYAMYEGDGTNLSPIRVHFTVPTKKYYFNDISVMPGGYWYGDKEGSDINLSKVKCNSEIFYKLNPTGNEITFRDMEENCHKCKPEGSEVSGGPKGKDCTIKIHEEVHFFEDEKRTTLYDSSDPIKALAFKEGGYMEFNLSNISYNTPSTLTSHVEYKGMPIVPTTFYAKDVQGIYLNNWLYNQYREANVTAFTPAP